MIPNQQNTQKFYLLESEIFSPNGKKWLLLGTIIVVWLSKSNWANWSARPSSMGASGERAAEKKEAVDRTTFNAATALNATNPWWPAIGLYRRVIRFFRLSQPRPISHSTYFWWLSSREIRGRCDISFEEQLNWYAWISKWCLMIEWLMISSKLTKIDLPNDLPNQCTDLPGSCFCRHAHVSISSTCSHLHHLHYDSCLCSCPSSLSLQHVWLQGNMYIVQLAIIHRWFVGFQKPPVGFYLFQQWIYMDS